MTKRPIWLTRQTTELILGIAIFIIIMYTALVILFTRPQSNTTQELIMLFCDVFFLAILCIAPIGLLGSIVWETYYGSTQPHSKVEHICFSTIYGIIAIICIVMATCTTWNYTITLGSCNLPTFICLMVFALFFIGIVHDCISFHNRGPNFRALTFAEFAQSHQTNRD